MNKINFCPECREQADYIIKKEKRKYVIKEKAYTFLITTAYCSNCGKELDLPGLMDLQMKEVDQQYRKEENIVSIDDIKRLMALYDLGKAPLSLALGFGEITITRYLKGQVPSKEYSHIIQCALRSPRYMNQMLNKNKNKIGTTAYEKAKQCVNHLEKLFNISPKLLATISYIFEETLEVTPLALQKLLYFMQGMYLALYDIPLFDEDCYAWVHGPVYDNVYNLFKEFKYNPIDDNRFIIVKNRFVELSKQEKEVILLVLDSFGNYSGKILENITHKEVPWIDSRKGYSPLEPSNSIITKEQIKSYFKGIDQEYRISSLEGINKYIHKQIS